MQVTILIIYLRILHWLVVVKIIRQEKFQGIVDSICYYNNLQSYYSRDKWKESWKLNHSIAFVHTYDF